MGFHVIGYDSFRLVLEAQILFILNSYAIRVSIFRSQQDAFSALCCQGTSMSPPIVVITRGKRVAMVVQR